MFSGIWRHVFHRKSPEIMTEKSPRRTWEVRNQRETGGKQISVNHLFSRYFLAPHTLWLWRWTRFVTPKLRLTFSRLHAVICQDTILFITTAVRTSNLTIVQLLTPGTILKLCLFLITYVLQEMLSCKRTKYSQCCVCFCRFPQIEEDVHRSCIKILATNISLENETYKTSFLVMCI
jgi:hypothetical protein